MKINDFATDKLVEDTPEGRVRQDYEKILVNNYGYEKSQLDIEFSIPRGTGYYPDRADIVIFDSSNNHDPASNIIGIVETKRPYKKDGLSQLKSYMTATSATWGVWTNGNDIAYLYKPKEENRILENHLNNIPAKGQSIEDIGRIDKQNLQPFGREELKTAFRRILHTLYANANISRREKLGSEMIKLIFAKIEDEKTYLDRIPDFRAEAGEDTKEIRNRIDKLFERVKKELKNDDVFKPGDSITLDDKSVSWVVGQLERGSLLKTDTDVIGDAFEIFAESRLKGEKGEFFTPRGVIKIAVKLTDPKPEETICDPACGSGGFLIYSMKHIWSLMDNDHKWKGTPKLEQTKKDMASRCIFGIDKEADLVKIAKAYMAISGDGRSNMIHENSLHDIHEFSPISKQTFIEKNNIKQFDVILTNPPFGTKTKVVKQDSKKFDLGYRWKKLNKNSWHKTRQVCERDPYVLFIERCFDMLKEDGRLGIILPETVFHAPTTEYIRNFIVSNFSIKAIIDLPHNSFRPHCNAKTCLLILKKSNNQGCKVLMSKPEEIGHDHQGKPIFRRGTTDIWDDLKIVLEEVNDPNSKTNKFTFLVDWELIKKHKNLVPVYYKSLINPPKMPKDCYGIKMGSLFEDRIFDAFDGHGSPPSSSKGQGPIPYIRVSDIVNWELYKNPVSGITREVYAKMILNKKKPEQEDIIFVRRGSYRIGTVAMASPYDKDVLLTRELLTFRLLQPENEHEINSFYLLWLLSSDFVQKQIPSKVFIDTTLPNISDRWKSIILPIYKDKVKIRSCTKEIKSIINLKWEAQKKINYKKKFSHFVT